ncbi:MAG TPA: alpha/beta hydrolase [Thermoanaerobaculia bacterium]|nr:alpha/beta hydrolase [Thermoanaerobaculia bacterium]
MTTKPVVYRMPEEEAVIVRRDVVYQETEAGALTADLYYPPDFKSGDRRPAVIFVIGYPDPGARKFLGCRFFEMESFISWGRLTAASGMVAVTYTTGQDPAADIYALLQFVRQNAESLGVDETRIGLWACSGHVPNTLSVLMQEGPDSFKCAALCYGITMDLDGSAHVAELASAFKFVTPAAGRSVEDLPRDLPLFIARAGKDEFPHLNETMDRFLAKALAANLPITLVNHPTAPHGFDFMDDSETSREIVRQILAFLRFQLLVTGEERFPGDREAR